jgi:hypothetical protein
MTTIKTLTSAAAIAATLGVIAATAPAQAGSFTFHVGNYNRGYVVYQQPTCYLNHWNGWKWVTRKYVGPICYETSYRTNHTFY